MKHPILTGLVLLFLSGFPTGAQSLMISEFMAANTRGLTDEDGEFPDWVEIHNGGAEPVNLLDWSLTDDAGNRTKWRFPATNLPPGRFMVVFASGKNRRVPGAPLHTNFRLSADGEYLGLIRPDGVTVASAFAPVFPPQSSDIAYGLAATGSNSVLVATGAVARAWVPRDDSAGLAWTQPGFDDSGWAAGTTGVGYERSSGYESLLGLNLLSPALPPALGIDANNDGVADNTSVYVRIPFVLNNPAAYNTLRLRMRHDDGFVAYLNGRPIASDNEVLPVTWNSRAAEDYGDATDVMLAIVYGPGNNITLYRDGEVYADGAHASLGTLQSYPAGVADILLGKRHEDLGDGGTAGGADGFLAGSLNEARLYNAALGAAAIRQLHLHGPLGGTNPPPAAIATNLLHLWSFNDGTARDGVAAAHGTLFNGAVIQQGRLVLDGINDYVRTTPIRSNVTERTLVVWVSLANLTQQAGSAMTLENPTGTDTFDGIVFAERVPRQWMNGSSFFARSVADNGGAAETVIETTTADFVAYDVSAATDALRAGTNILAIHALNLSPEDSDLLVLPELLAGTYTLVTNGTGYLDQPTPGAMNNATFQRLSAVPGFSRERGFQSAPFSLVLTSAVPAATLRYTLDGSPPGPTNGLVYSGPLAVNRTTIVRAALVQAGYAPGGIVTHTYVFVDDVLRQTNTAPAGAHWDTEMDPVVVNNTNQAWTVAQGLVDLPTVSIVMHQADLFGPNGIYVNSTARGDEWERAASVEMFYPDDYTGYRGGRGFAINCGIQINGNFSRLTHQPKHSFRLVFKDQWGPAQLEYPVFADYDVTRFDTLLVACGHNQGWSTGIPNTQFLRNRFTWDLEGAVPGRAQVHSRSVHVYLNGLYWGIYDLGERPDEAFSAANFGGAKAEYDVFKGLQAGGSTQARNVNGFRDAWAALFDLAGRNLTVASNYTAIAGLVDLDQFIDYSIGILYTADRDGPTGWLNGPPNSLEPKNFYATRRRAADGRFRFWRWDSEFALEDENEDVSERNGYENPGLLHFNLRANPEYRLRFADRVQQLFFNHGPYSSNALTARYLALAGEIDRAVVAESARWGDAKREPPFTRGVEWVAERDRIVKSYLPRRQGIFLNQLRVDGLFPAFSAPALVLDGQPRHGGEFTPGGLLSLTATNGQIYYTLDGSDPRLAGGGIAPGAILYTGPVALPDSVVVRARVWSSGQWSALTAATFEALPDWSRLQVTEIMYQPPATVDASGDNAEFLELKNTGTRTLALDGVVFTAGIAHRFPPGTLLAPGQFLVLVRDAAQFAGRYPGVVVHGVYTGSLDNNGETLRLEHPTRGTILEFNYGDAPPWPVTPGGMGYSLVPREVVADPDPDSAIHWRASTAPGGSPGTEDPPSPIPPLRINEALSASVPPQLDFIELFNPTTNAVNCGGWWLTDDRSQPRKFRLPAGTILTAGSFRIFDERDFNVAGASNAFALNSSGDAVHLFSADAAGNLTGYDHGFTLGAAAPGVSFGRHPLSTGAEDFPAQAGLTPGTTNSGPFIGPVVITEVHHHPVADGDEFVELVNITGGPVNLHDPANPASPWRINGLDFTFPTGFQLAPGERVLVSAAAPGEFRTRWGIAPGVRVLGPFAGALQRDGERLELQRPGPAGTNGPVFITVDEVRYNDRPPWPRAADGGGASLQRIAANGYGNDPANWVAAVPTPGTGYPGGTAPQIFAPPTNVTTVAYLDAAFSVVAGGAPPLHYQWQFNGSPLPGATNSTLTITNAQPIHAGSYGVFVFNAAGSIASSNATLTVLVPAVITQQPTNRTVNAGTTATFVVSATGQGTLRYQWRFNGVNLPGQTNATLTLTNVQPALEGAYMVVVTDAIGATPSQTAFLTVLVRPAILLQPLGQSVLEGGTVTFQTAVSGTPPMTYRWRRNGSTLISVRTNLLTSSYSITNVQASHAGTYSVIVNNSVGSAPASSNAVLVVLADFDRDGIADLWEVANGFSTNNAADSLLDADADGMSNRGEYIAGTDPRDTRSYLRVNGLVPGHETALTFSAVSNRAYNVQFTDALGTGSWQVLTNLAPVSTNRTLRITDPAPSPGRYYRLQIP